VVPFEPFECLDERELDSFDEPELCPKVEAEFLLESAVFDCSPELMPVVAEEFSPLDDVPRMSLAELCSWVLEAGEF
jgi:hypothetical protein